MRIPSLPEFHDRRTALLAGAAGLAVLVVVCVIAIAIRGGHTVDSTGSATPETAETAETSAPAATAAPDPAAQAVEAAAQGTVLAQTQDAGRAYVEQTLFIGDSNTARYLMYADETGQAFTSLDNNIGVVSMGVGAITSLKCEKFKGSSTMYTVPESVAMLKPQRIIICYGTNNLGGSSTDATQFIATYLQGLQAIQKAWPYCDIIVSAIPPLDKQRENTNLTMVQVDAYNAALVTMCEENGYKFLNSAEVLRDSATGWAKTDYTLSDGVHLSKAAVTAYFQYVRTHAHVTEDRRPQPLGNIPTPDGVPANLISEDPIAIRGAKVPLEFVATNGGKLSGSTSQLVKKGGTASAVTAVPNEGFVFAGWTASTGGSYSSATLSFTMPTNANAGGVVLTAHFTADAHEHDYVEIPDTKVAPTCLTGGSVQYECTICGEIMEKDLPPLGHDWDDGNRSGDQITYTCRRCGATKSEAVAHEHNYSELVGHTDATCTQPETSTYRCSCGATITTQGEAARGHQPVTQADGSVVCGICGAKLQDAPAPPPPTEAPVVTAPPTEVPPTEAPPVVETSTPPPEPTPAQPDPPAGGEGEGGDPAGEVTTEEAPEPAPQPEAIPIPQAEAAPEPAPEAAP